MKQVIRLILQIILGIFYRVEIIGRVNIPAQGAALLCANHESGMDMFFFGYRIKRLIHYMAKEELFKFPPMAALITWLGAFPVKRGKGDIGAIKAALRILEEGHIVGIYPQGTRAKGKNANEIKVQSGVALLAIKSRAPILPVAISSDNKLFGRVKVVFGKPYNLDIQEGKKYTGEEMAVISSDIMKRVYSLLEEK